MSQMVLAEILRPSDRVVAKYYEATLILAGSLLLAVSAQIAFWLPFSPVPVTAQTFAVLTLAALLGPRNATLAVLAYILEGLCGLPVFASARSGLIVILGPTGGYLFGFLAAAFVVGSLARLGWDRTVLRSVFAMAIGIFVIYSFGLVWLAVYTGFNKTLLIAGLYPFIAGEFFKIAFAAAVLPSAWKCLSLMKR